MCVVAQARAGRDPGLAVGQLTVWRNAAARFRTDLPSLARLSIRLTKTGRLAADAAGPLGPVWPAPGNGAARQRLW